MIGKSRSASTPGAPWACMKVQKVIFHNQSQTIIPGPVQAHLDTLATLDRATCQWMPSLEKYGWYVKKLLLSRGTCITAWFVYV